MPASSSAKALEAELFKEAAPDWPRPLRLAMVLLNFVPLLHAAGASWLAASGPGDGRQRTALALAALFLCPPVAVRLLFLAFGKPQGRLPAGSPGFLVWWASLQLQMLFCRLPFLEEAMRLFPGLYSSWLRLWGSRIGALTYWAAGTTVLDRSYLHIGDGVLFGAGVRLNGHVIAKDGEGRLELALAPIRIGDGASVGGYSLLTAGTEIAPGEATRAYLLSPPFSVWKDGKRMKDRREVSDELG